jgi:hypothetical protein
MTTDPPFHVSFLSVTLFGLSAMLDSGKHDDISLQDVIRHIQSGDLIHFLNEKAGYAFDQGLSEAEPAFSGWYVEKLKENCEVMEDREGRKYGIRNRGLCLLISYTAEIIQHSENIRLK